MNIRELLFENASKEQSDFIDSLKMLNPEQIIEQAYEIIMREDILITFEFEQEAKRLSDKQVEALLKLDYPLSVCYDEWQKNDITYMDRIYDTIDICSRKIAERQKEETPKKKHEPER